MSQDDADVRKRLAAMSEGEPSQAKRPTRPARPAAPKPVPPAPLERMEASAVPDRPVTLPNARPPSPARPSAPAPRAASPTAPPSFAQNPVAAEATTVPMPALRPSQRDAAKRLPPKKATLADFAPTLLPPSLTLGVSLPLLGAGWFALDRFSILRDNPIGVALPLGLIVCGVLFLALAAFMIAQTRRAPSTQQTAESGGD